MTTNTLPAPTEGHRAYPSISATDGYAVASVMRPGHGFTIVDDGRGFITLRATQPREERSIDAQVSICIHRNGIPALIAELQRLTQ